MVNTESVYPLLITKPNPLGDIVPLPLVLKGLVGDIQHFCQGPYITLRGEVPQNVR